ncbi:MAG: Rpn family recombination-promoting nuclease/putative transposase, partial [Clostridium sp.]
LEYVEASNEDTAKKSKGNLVKHIHERVEKIKRDVTMEVEFMTLLQRDKEKIEEGIKKVAINLLDILDDKTISEKTGLTIEEVITLRESAKNI